MDSSSFHQCWVFLLLLPKAAGQVTFTSPYSKTDVIGVAGSSIDFTWPFTGAFFTARFGVKAGNTISDILVTVAGATGSVTLRDSSQNPSYNGRMNGSWDGKTSPGEVTFTLSSIKKADANSFGCEIAPQHLDSSTITDFVRLVVFEPPVITPLSVSNPHTKGSEVKINCTATGTPTLDVKWIRSGQVKASGQGSAVLFFNSVSKTDAGPYHCNATNSVGSAESSFTLVVHYPAVVTSFSASVDTSWIGQVVKISCVSDGVPTPTLTLYKPRGDALQTVTATEITRDVMMNGDDDFGEYTCTADNGVPPSDTEKVTVDQISEPGSPNITSSDEDIQATSLTVRWTKPADDGGSPITAYRVVLMAGNGTEIKNENITDSTKRSLPLGGLDKDTNYTVKVYARNFVFEGSAGETALKTKFQGKPAAAELVNVPAEVKSEEVTLKWNEPENNGAAITQYTVYQRTVSEDGTTGGDWTELKVITNISVREYVVKLEKGKDYEFVVTATNSFGEGLKEEGKIERVKVPGEAPGPVELTDLPDEVEGTEVTLKWNEPDNNGGAITQYTVYQRTASEDSTTGDWTKVTDVTEPLATEYTVKLEKGKEYEFVVTATNKFGEGSKDGGNVKRVKVLSATADDPQESEGVDIAIVAGAAAAGVLLIVGIAIFIVLLKRRKHSSQEETSRDELGGGHPGYPDEGYASVSRAAAQSLRAPGPSAEVNYAVVDPSSRRSNRQPVTDQYAQVDPAKKNKNKKKRKNPNELDYAELADFRPDNQAAAPVPAPPPAASRPPAYEGTMYADISQFGVPQADPTYANVTKEDVVYSNVESM